MKIPVVPTVALLAAVFAAYHVSHSQTPPVQLTPPVEPARSPYTDKVAGAGIVEPRSQNISIATEIAGVVRELLVREGDQVSTDQPLFRLDTRDIEAELKVRRAMLKSTEAERTRLRQQPRLEELPPLVASVAESEAVLRQATDIFERQQKLTRQGVTTQEELVIAQANRDTAAARRNKAAADLSLVKAGAWEQDLLVSDVNVERMALEVERYEVELARHEIRAPQARAEPGLSGDVRWEVLQVNIRPGEFVATPPVEPTIVLGDLGPRRIRVDIDEYDLPRFHPTGAAVAYARGDGARAFPLKFVRIDPYVIPKRSLTGDNADRVDTRVLQVIYEFTESTREIYVGQQMDVFIETKPKSEIASSRASESES